MSENEKTGKEPFERIKLYQDFCNLTWSEGACYAGRTNFFPESDDFSDGDNWDNEAYTSTPGQSGPNGSTTAILLERTAAVSIFLQTPANVPTGTSNTLYWTFAIKQVSASIGAVDAYVTRADGTFVPARLDITDGSVILNSGSPLGAIVTESLGDGWYKWEIEIDRSATQQPAAFVLLFSETGAGSPTPSEGDQVLVDLFSLSDIQGQEYVPTSGEAITAVSSIPCFNTRATCQVPDVYDRGELELKFCKKQRRLPRGEYHIPSLSSVRITPGSINPGGSDSNVSAMGKRGTISASFEDHTHSDLLVDKYRLERGYDPKERSTFWSKWRSRNPYYMHRRLVYESGYILDGQVVDSITRTFFITGFSGPDANGRVSISGKDVLTLAANDKAKAPFASTGKLDADISDFATSITLTPSGIGDLEYPASGFVRISKEVLEFTRVGDVLTVTRAQYGTESDEHDEGDTVQLCLVYESAAPSDILYDFLNTYAKVPDEFLDKTQWDAEQLDYLPRRYSAIISEPEGITKLVNEMCQQMHFTTWFDERESLVKMRAVRPAENDTIYELNDNANLKMDSIQWTDKADELVTQVWVYYGQINPTEKLDQGDNYAALDVIADLGSEGADRNNLSRIKTIYSRWIDATNGAAAIDLGNKILARYASAPRVCTFSLDAKDRDVWLANFVRLTNRLRVDFDGNPVPVNMQVFEAQESQAGTTFTYKAKEYVAQLTNDDSVQDPNVRNIIISADTLNVNLRELHDSQYAPPTGTETITVTVRNGVTLGGYAADDNTNVPYGQRDTTNDFYDGGTGSVSGLTAGQIPILQRRGIGSVRTTNSGASYAGGGGNADFEIREYPISTALDTGTWPAGVTLNLVVEAGARILGEGGNGSAHGLSGTDFFRQGLSGTTSTRGYNCVSGADGGNAVRIQYPISITNGGVIASGGGGGGSALANGADNQDPTEWVMAPGGGGGGLEISDTTTVITRNGPSILRQPSSGSATDGGSGGRARITREAAITGYNLFNDVRAGAGSDLASQGSSSSFVVSGTGISTVTYSGSQGGQPGDAIAEGADMVTWVNKGDVRGAENI